MIEQKDIESIKDVYYLNSDFLKSYSNKKNPKINTLSNSPNQSKDDGIEPTIYQKTKNVKQIIVCDILFCKFLNRNLKLLQKVDIIQSPFTKSKLRYLFLKNAVMKMNKLSILIND